MLANAFTQCNNALDGTTDGCSVFTDTKDQDAANACYASGQLVNEVSAPWSTEHVAYDRRSGWMYLWSTYRETTLYTTRLARPQTTQSSHEMGMSRLHRSWMCPRIARAHALASAQGFATITTVVESRASPKARSAPAGNL